MPSSPPTICAAPGCSRLTTRGRCDEHRGEYDRTGRPDRHRFYDTARWRRISRRHRQLHPLCEHCRKIGQLVHHRVPIEDAPELAFRVDLLETLCHACHNKVHGSDASSDSLRGGGWGGGVRTVTVAGEDE